MTDVWDWEEIDAGRSGSSGDLAKLFKNEGAKNPGALKVGAPPTDATLLARESIQNSWDAARALAKKLHDDGVEPPPFTMRFRYRSLVGADKAELVSSLGLSELADRAGRSDRKKLGLAAEDALDELDQPEEPLRILLAEEEGTTGMDGPWKGADSRLYLALVSIGFTVKAEGSGGSYGYGKAGLIRASATRTVIAHTCFGERADDSGVTRRLLGMTYWGLHDLDDNSYTGFARLGVPGDGPVVPFENDTADALARSLGIRIRDPEVVDDLGSTFLLVDPIVEPGDLCRAVERSWWPALTDRLIDVEIEDVDGTILHPRPMRDDVLRTFVRGYELATQHQDNSPENEFKRRLKPYQPAGSKQYELGSIGLNADLASWSYAHDSGAEDDDAAVDHRTLVALVRGPRMVVEYLPVGRNQPPYVRGVFVADEQIDDLLRQTEPKAHDAWLPKLEEEGIDRDAPKVADQVLRRIGQHVREFKKQLKPPPTREQDIHLPLLDDLFRDLVEDRGTRNPPPPPPDPRRVAIRVTRGVEQAGGDAIRLAATAKFNLTSNHPDAEAEVRLVFRYAFDEDGALGDDCPLELGDLPAGFAILGRDDRGTTVEGVLTHDETTFSLRSHSYDADWSGQLIVIGDVIAADEPEPAAEPA